MSSDVDMMRLRAINEAIWLRDHWSNLERKELFRIIEDIGEYNMFSARQIGGMINNTISRQIISKLCNKTDKTGGRLEVKDLEKIREIFYGKSNGVLNNSLIREVLNNGTSQGMLSKLTGINQSTISKVGNVID